MCDGTEYGAKDPITYEEMKLAEAMKMILENKNLSASYRNKALERGQQFDKDEIMNQWYALIEE